jgi:hypothetical protein
LTGIVTLPLRSGKVVSLVASNEAGPGEPGIASQRTCCVPSYEPCPLSACSAISSAGRGPSAWRRLGKRRACGVHGEYGHRRTT